MNLFVKHCAIVTLLVATGCEAVPPDGFGVNLTLSLADVRAESRGALARFIVRVTGDEQYETELSRAAFQDGEARFRYLPQVASGTLRFDVDALDDAALVAARGGERTDLVPSRAVALSLRLVGVVDSDCPQEDNCPSPSSSPSPSPSPCPAGGCGLALGATCGAAGDCGSGFCVDGVCCDSACDGTCRTCDASASARGTCTPIVLAEEPLCKSGPQGAQMCDAQGACVQPHLVHDFGPAPSPPAQYVAGPNGQVFFAAQDGYGRELWITDGTDTGTRRVADLRPGTSSGNPVDLISVGGIAIFQTLEGADTRTKLFRSDGTAAGTYLIKDLFPGNYADPRGFTEWNGFVYFSASSAGTGAELWRTDGTEANTSLVKDIAASSSAAPAGFTAFGGHLYFSAYEPGYGRELWRTDGTQAGTTRFIELVPNATDGDPVNFFASSQGLYFAATSQRTAWLSDGTAPNTRLLTDSFNSSGSGGTGAQSFTQIGNRIYYVASRTNYGTELFVSDGTYNSTEMIDIYATYNSSNPRSLIAYDGALFFIANDQFDPQGALWRLDAGGVPTKVIRFSSGPPTELSLFGETLLIKANGGELLGSDGTELGTHPMCGAAAACPGASDFRVIGDRLYFSSYDSASTTRSTWVFP